MDTETVTKDELELINRYSRKPLEGKDVYTFSVVLCDNEIDRDFEYFSDDALEKLARMYVGVTGIYDHEPSAKNQVARIYDCGVERVEGRKTSYGADYKRLVAKAYIPVCKSSEELIAMLDSGIKKEVSVGCGIGRCTCSICGEDMRHGGCDHIRGHEYDGQLCCGILSDPKDAYEWSFTAVPAQRGAGVIKSFLTENGYPDIKLGTRLERGELDELKAYINELRQKADEGERYKASLKLETVKAGIVANVGIDSDLLESMVRSLTVDELMRLKESFEKAGEKLFPARAQTASARRELDVGTDGKGNFDV